VKRTIILFMAVAVTVGAVWMLSLRSNSEARKMDLIDGGRDQNAIPDRIAYSLMLRLISGARDENEKRYVQSYVARIGIHDKDDVRVLSATADKFKQKVQELDAEVTELKQTESENRTERLPSTQHQLRELRLRFDAAIQEAIASLSHDMSKRGFAQLKQFMNGEFKSKVKLRTGSKP